jgi:arylsulfatase A-like enzyme
MKYPLSVKQSAELTALGGIYFLLSSCAIDGTRKNDQKLNVVIFIADDLRWNSLGCAGNSILMTPNIDNLARNGVRFSNACVTTSISMVSRANMLTGQYMSRHKIREFGVQLSEQAFSQTYPAILRKAGWWTGYVGKYGVGKIKENNFDFSIEYEGRHWLKAGNGDSIHVTKKNTLDAIRFLNERPTDKPFMLTVGFFATHAQDNHPDQYLYQPESERYYTDVAIPVPVTASDKYFNLLPPFISNEKNEGRIRWHWRFDTPEKYQKYMKAYFRMLTELDIAVGEITAELKKQGVLDNTLIIFMGDNGYFHSEHGLADKWYPYQESIKVPLIVCDPRLSKNKRNTVNEEFVLNIDIAPAIIAAVGQPIPETMQGKDFSILYLNEKRQGWRKEFFYEHPFVTSEQRIPSSEAIVTHSEKYIYWPHYNYEEYFDLKIDPLEVNNAINDSTCSEKIESIKKRFIKLREQAK